MANQPGDTLGPNQVQDVDVPRVVETRYNDTVDAGDGTLYQRIDGKFVAVEDVL